MLSWLRIINSNVPFMIFACQSLLNYNSISIFVTLLYLSVNKLKGTREKLKLLKIFFIHSA